MTNELLRARGRSLTPRAGRSLDQLPQRPQRAADRALRPSLVPPADRRLPASPARLAGLSLLACLAAAACGTSAAESPRTIALVTLDTLRSDHLSCYGYPRETSPFLDRMAAEGVRFENAIAVGSHTAPTHASIFTGLYPIQHRVLENGQRLRPEFAPLAGVLKEAGYDTAAFISVGFLQGLDAGFDHFVPGDYEDDARDVLGRAEEWLTARAGTAAASRPLFLWIHLYDAHQPYVAGDTEYFQELQLAGEAERQAHFEYVTGEQGVYESFLDELPIPDDSGLATSQDLVMRLVDHYDAEIRFADGALEEFHAFATELGLNRDALWVFVADHGEGLGCHRLLGHDRHVYQEQLRIPLIVHGAGVVPGVTDQLVRQVDLLPTILEWADAPLPADGPAELQGMSLMPLLAAEAEELPILYAFSQRRTPVEAWRNDAMYALQTPRFKFIFRSDMRDELYDLEQDPLEHVNLVDSHLQKGERMRRTARELVTEWQTTSHLEPLVDGDGHAEELSALGYLGDD